jgi:hypothetical protein
VHALAAYDDEEMAEFLFPEDDSSETTHDLDKSWDAIGHLLAASTRGSLTTLLGGAEIGPDLGYGPARFMTPDEVRAAATALERVDREALLAHFDAKALMKSEVYPEAWEDSQEHRDYIGQHYELARSVFLEAARAYSAVLVWLA